MNKEKLITLLKRESVVEVIYYYYVEHFHRARPVKGREPKMLSASKFSSLIGFMPRVDDMYKIAVDYYLDKFNLTQLHVQGKKYMYDGKEYRDKITTLIY